MCILDIRKKYKKTTLTYLGITLFCILFNFVYEQFSYGESSPYMRFMFAAPAVCGIMPFFISFCFSIAGKKIWRKNRVAFNLWNSGIAVLASGCLVTGIIHISGRTCEYSIFYWITGSIFLFAGVLYHLIFPKLSKFMFHGQKTV